MPPKRDRVRPPAPTPRRPSPPKRARPRALRLLDLPLKLVRLLSAYLRPDTRSRVALSLTCKDLLREMPVASVTQGCPLWGKLGNFSCIGYGWPTRFHLCARVRLQMRILAEMADHVGPHSPHMKDELAFFLALGARADPHPLPVCREAIDEYYRSNHPYGLDVAAHALSSLAQGLSYTPYRVGFPLWKQLCYWLVHWVEACLSSSVERCRRFVLDRMAAAYLPWFLAWLARNGRREEVSKLVGVVSTLTTTANMGIDEDGATTSLLSLVYFGEPEYGVGKLGRTILQTARDSFYARGAGYEDAIQMLCA